jgi:predicted naringenin-chalcone synthase
MAAAFQHYLLHTGGRGVLDSVQSSLGLSPEQVPAPAA